MIIIGIFTLGALSGTNDIYQTDIIIQLSDGTRSARACAFTLLYQCIESFDGVDVTRSVEYFSSDGVQTFSCVRD